MKKTFFYVSTLRYFFLNILLFNFVKNENFQRILIEKIKSIGSPLEIPFPFNDSSKKVDVDFQLYLKKIIDINEKEQSISIIVWTLTSWVDPNIKWDPNEFGNLTAIGISREFLWKPDIILINTAGDNFEEINKDNILIVNYNGTIELEQTGILNSICEINIENFPFDEQQCCFEFIDWSYFKYTNINSSFDKVALQNYKKNGKWILKNSKAYANESNYSNEIGNRIFLEFNLKRRPLYYIFNLIIPCILISFMSVLGFLLPPESGEKIALEMTTLLTIITFSQQVSNTIPENSLSAPKIGIYFSCVMISSTFSIVMNVVIIMMFYKNSNIHGPMPTWLYRIICIYLAGILNMKIKLDNNNKIEPSESDYIDDLEEIKNELKQNNQNSKKSKFLENKLQDLIERRKFKIQDIKQTFDELNWKFAALVIDRFFAIFFFFYNFVINNYYFNYLFCLL